MTIKVSDIANYLNTDFKGDDIVINGVSSISNIKNNTLCFVKNKQNIVSKKPFLLLAPRAYTNDALCSTIIVENPRLAYAKVVNNFFLEKKDINSSTMLNIHSTAIIGKEAHVGSYSSIGKNVKIGVGTIIENNVHIDDNTSIGDYCYIKSNTVIGESGFGFVFDNEVPIKIAHLGDVIIKNNVEIGANCTVARGTIDSTVIRDHVKIDDHVHIAHNCTIGSKTIITAHVLLSGSVTIGKSCWIGPNSSIIQNILIGDNSLIGIGSIITKDLPNKSKVMGLHSIPLKMLAKFKRFSKYGA